MFCKSDICKASEVPSLVIGVLFFRKERIPNPVRRI